jgi:DNA-binding LacI/PurR family transcriptional regulator
MLKKNIKRPRENIKYRKVFNDMRRRILSGEFSVNKRLLGQFALAREYNLSAITTNRALNELELAGLIRRRMRSGSYVRENPRFVSELFVVSSGKIKDEESWIGDYWKGILEGAEESEIPVHILKATDPMFQKKVLFEGCTHGVILLGFETPKLVRALEKLKIPHVLAATEARRAKYCAVENRRQAAEYLTEALFKSGCQRIVFIGDMSKPNHRTGSEGFISAVSRLTKKKAVLLNAETDSVSDIVENLLKSQKRPDGLIITGGNLPFAALPALFNSRYRPQLGFMTEHPNVMMLKGIGHIASYSQFETGKNAFDLLSEIVRNTDAKPKTVYTKSEIITPVSR